MHADVSVRRVAPASRKLASRTLMQTHRAQMENSRHPETLRCPDPRSKNSASHGTSKPQGAAFQIKRAESQRLRRPRRHPRAGHLESLDNRSLAAATTLSIILWNQTANAIPNTT